MHSIRDMEKMAAEFTKSPPIYTGNGDIRTYTGAMIDPFTLREDQVDAVDCIHALSLINRFTGHSLRPYSVMEHSLHLTEFVPDELKQAAFIHDWSETYFNDIARPVKKRFKEYKAHEREAQKVIFDAMSVDFDLLEEIDPYDKRICSDEMLSMFDPPFKHYEEPLGVTISSAPGSGNWQWIRSCAWRTFQELFPLQAKGVKPRWLLKEWD